MMGLMAAGLMPGTARGDETVTLESTGGSKVTAKLVSSDDAGVTVIRISDQKSFVIPLDKLTDRSKKMVADWKSGGGGLLAKFDIAVTTGKTRKTTAREDFDDKRVTLDPVVTVSNPDTKQATRAAKVTVLFLGKPVADPGAIHVFKTQTFDLASLPHGGKKEFAVGKISSAYDSRGYAKFGARYFGYVVLVHDAEGSVLYSAKAVPSSLEKTGLAFLRLKAGKSYGKQWEQVELPTYTDD